MSHRVLWPLGGLLTLLVLVASFNQAPAQPRPALPLIGGQVGRFVVAHASEKQIIILDTTTGKLYKATEKDFEKYSELPKTAPLEIPLPFLDKDKKKDGPVKDKVKVPTPDKDRKEEKDRKKDDEQIRREKELKEAERRAREAEERAREAQKQAEQERDRAVEAERRARQEAERQKQKAEEE